MGKKIFYFIFGLFTGLGLLFGSLVALVSLDVVSGKYLIVKILVLFLLLAIVLLKLIGRKNKARFCGAIVSIILSAIMTSMIAFDLQRYGHASGLVVNIAGLSIPALIISGLLVFALRNQNNAPIEEKTMGKKRLVGLTFLVVCDVLLGALHILLFIAFLYPALKIAFFYLLLGSLYIYCSTGFINFIPKRRKIFLYASMPISILAMWKTIALIYDESSQWYQMPLSEVLPFVAVFILIPLIINLFYLTRPKVKEQFR